MRHTILGMAIAALVVTGCESTDTPGTTTTTTAAPAASCGDVRTADNLKDQLEAIKARLAPLQAAMEGAGGNAGQSTAAYLEALKREYAGLGELGKQAGTVRDQSGTDLKVHCLVTGADAAMLQAYLPVSSRPNPEVFPETSARAMARRATNFCVGLSVGNVGPLLPERCALANAIEGGAPLLQARNALREASPQTTADNAAGDWGASTDTIRAYTASLDALPAKRAAIVGFTPSAAAKQAAFIEEYFKRPACDVRLDGRRLLDRQSSVPETAMDAWSVYSNEYAKAVRETNQAFNLKISDADTRACQAGAEDVANVRTCRRANENALIAFCNPS